MIPEHTRKKGKLLSALFSELVVSAEEAEWIIMVGIYAQRGLLSELMNVRHITNYKGTDPLGYSAEMPPHSGTAQGSCLWC